MLVSWNQFEAATCFVAITSSKPGGLCRYARRPGLPRLPDRLVPQKRKLPDPPVGLLGFEAQVGDPGRRNATLLDGRRKESRSSLRPVRRILDEAGGEAWSELQRPLTHCMSKKVGRVKQMEAKRGK